MQNKRQPRQRSSQLDIEKIFQRSEKLRQKKKFTAQKMAIQIKKSQSELINLHQTQFGMTTFQNRLNNTFLQNNENNLQNYQDQNLSKNHKNEKQKKGFKQKFGKKKRTHLDLLKTEKIIEESSVLLQSDMSEEEFNGKQSSYQKEKHYSNQNQSEQDFQKNQENDQVIKLNEQSSSQNQQLYYQQHQNQQEHNLQQQDSSNNLYSTQFDSNNNIKESQIQTQMVTEIQSNFFRNNLYDNESEMSKIKQSHYNNGNQNQRNDQKQMNQGESYTQTTTLDSNNTTSSGSNNNNTLNRNFNSSSSQGGTRQTMAELDLEEKQLKKLQKKLDKKYHFQRILKNMEISDQQNTYKIFSFIKRAAKSEGGLINIVINIFQNLFIEKYSFFMEYKPNEIRNEAIEFIFDSIISDIQFIFSFILKLLHTFFDDFVTNSLPNLDPNYKENEYKFITIRTLYRHKKINKTLLQIIKLKNYKSTRKLKQNLMVLQSMSIQNPVFNIPQKFQLISQNCQNSTQSGCFFDLYDNSNNNLHEKPYQKVIDQIKTIQQGVSPVMKFEIIVNLRSKIFEAVDEFYNLDNYGNDSPVKKNGNRKNSSKLNHEKKDKQIYVDGDTIDNILIYCIIQSKQYNLANQLEYIQEFMPEDLSYAYEEGSSFFSRILMTVQYLQMLDKEEITKFQAEEEKLQEEITKLFQIKENSNKIKFQKINREKQQSQIQELDFEESSEKYSSQIIKSDNIDTQNSEFLDNCDNQQEILINEFSV